MKLNSKLKTALPFLLSVLFFVALTLLTSSPEVGGMGAISMATLIPIWGNIKDGTFKELSVDEIAKLSDEDQAKYFSDKAANDQQKLDTLKTELVGLIAKSKADLISKEDFNTELESIKSQLKAIDAEKFNKFKETLKKLEEISKTQGTELAKLKDGGIPTSSKNAFKSEIKKALESEEYKEFVDSNGKKKASFSLKAVSITDDYTGNSLVHITSRDSRVVDHPEVTRLNVRDLLTVIPTDLPYLAFTEVYDWDRSTGTIGENGELAESSFKVREAQVDAKRIGTHIPLSKRMLRSASFVLGHIMQKMPAMVRYQEDFQLLYGDGNGDNVLGVDKKAQDFATLINTSITGTAGSIASVATYDGGAKALITFAANQNLNNGDTITIANATAGAYNASHTAIVKSPTEILIELAYVAESDTSEWTFTVNSPFKDSIEAAQEIDVLKVAKTLVTAQEYMATGIVLNPIDATKIETLKGNDEHYIDVQRLENGVLTIGGLPVVETTAMPAGKFIVGDWVLAAALAQFSELTLEFSESTQEKLKNMVEAIIQEEVLFPIYNPYMFVKGNFTTAKAAIGV
ncbi:phage major capsid protein [uncultured Winogradskyella sp.]|uniref:phage major capsid family protein n=1 Tax=uncultured Winogradskyella sp. TaxID=395353 RepID=UPI00262D87D7|nr:phage major capsid protein [uncultured Winogradskyella sp.]